MTWPIKQLPVIYKSDIQVNYKLHPWQGLVEIIANSINQRKDGKVMETVTIVARDFILESSQIAELLICQTHVNFA